MTKINFARIGWITTSSLIITMFGLIGYLSFLINRCNDYGYCESIHEYSARYANYTLTNSTTGSTIQYVFMALRDSRPFQEYVCDQEQITDMSRINRYIMKYIATETYTIYVKSNDDCTMQKRIPITNLLGFGIATILLVLICCATCCMMCLGADKRNSYLQREIAYPAPVVVPVAPVPQQVVVVSRNELSCHICMDRRIEIVFVGCGHTLCAECAMKLTICPMCRKPSNKIPLYT